MSLLMADSRSWVSHIEAFIDTSRPLDQQKAGVDLVSGLVKSDIITLEALVREMELYLTTTDDTIRARGILFLAEVLIHLLNKSLDKFTLSTLSGFFSARLADWRSLHGALIGCLALLRRKSNIGMVVDSDARTIAQSLLDNVQVQFLAMIDRKICFEVFQCLLDVYSDSVATLGDEFVYGLIQAVDQEKDPRCLSLTFNLIQSLVKLFVLRLGSTHVAQDLFEVLSCYFPIYFTHKIADDFEVKREDLSDSLMHAFCSTPYFEPFAIPLLLDKLSSTLPLAKIDSLKYLNKCLMCYGADKMVQHAQNIWFALKDIILSPSSQGETLSPSSFVLGGEINSHEHEIAKEALVCLKTTISLFTCPNNDDFLNLIIDDNDIERSFCFVTTEGSNSDNSDKTHFKLSALGSILSVMANSSIFCCNRVIQIFFSRLMDILGLNSSSSEHFPDVNVGTVFRNLNYGALYLCVELLTSCRDLAATAWESSLQKNFLQDSWWLLIQEFSDALITSFRSVLMIPNKVTAKCGNGNSKQELVLYSVKGLQMLAMYPGECTPVTKESLEKILETFMLVIIERSKESFLWKLSLKSLVQIGSSITRFKDFHMQMVYNEIVVRKLVLFLHEESILSLASTLEAIAEIGTCSLVFISQVIQGLEEAMLLKFLQTCVEGSSKSTKDLVLLLDCYFTKVLPWCYNSVSYEQPGIRFAISILEQMENIIALKMEPEMQGLLDKMMMTIKLIVSGCAEDSQLIILEKAYNIMLESTNLPSDALFCSGILQGLQFIPDIYEITCKNKWLLYHFASIVIALRQQTPLANVAKLRNTLLLFTLKGHLPAAQALASLINKLPSALDKLASSDSDILEETIEMILETFLSVLTNNHKKRPHKLSYNGGASMQSYSNLQVYAVVGMSWFGKAILMRGHGRVKDISMIILKCLLSSQDIIISSSHHSSDISIGENMQHIVALSAADAFHILLSDSEACLNKNFHAIIKPLYKQRFFSSMLPVLHSAIKECNSSRIRVLLYRAFGHIISGMPLVVLVADANKVLPLLLDGLSVLDLDIINKDLIYSLLLVLSGFLIDEKGKEDIIGYAHIVINNLIKLISYPHMMLVRETVIECLASLTSLPYTRIYPLRTQVLDALSRALGDKKRIIRREAVKCRHVWASLATTSLHLR